MDILEQFKIAYDIHRWLRYMTWLTLIGGVLLLLWVSGGFPPRTWHLLVQVIPQFPHLWGIRGPAILLPLAAVAVLSLTWGILWSLLLLAGMAVGWHWYRSLFRQQLTRTNWMPSHANPGNPGQAQGSLRRTTPPLAPTRYDKGEHKVLSTTPLHPLPLQATASPASYAKTGEPAPGSAVMSKSTLRLSMEVGVGWDAGSTRKQKPNEDSLVVLRSTCTRKGRLLPLDLFVVADGMGGHSCGQEASRLAVQSMTRSVLPNILSSDQLSGEFILLALEESVQWANRAVYQYAQKHDVEMGTTLTAALVVDAIAYIINVGDSRTYLYRQGEGLSQVTRDHSLVARLVETGAISPDEVYTHPDRNQVYRGLGDKHEVMVDWFTVRLLKGDRLVLCSDGLWEMVRDQEIERIVKKLGATPSQASDALVRAALQGGGKDNISVIVVGVAS